MDISLLNLFDTHCHFDFEPFQDDIEHHLFLAQEYGVRKMIVPSIGPKNWPSVVELTSRFSSICHSALGYHPLFVTEFSKEQYDELERAIHINIKSCVAIGECGLDASVTMHLNDQIKLLEMQLSLAEQYHLPIIIHSRKTHHHILALLKKHHFSQGGVIHGFSGSYQQAMQFIEKGFKIGIGGVITYPRAIKTRKTIQQLPIDTIVLETDAPSMPLWGKQGESNHPKRLHLILNEISILRQDDICDISNIIWNNSHDLFDVNISK